MEEITKEVLLEALETLEEGGDFMEDGVESEDKIPFNLECIASYEQVTNPKHDSFDKGVEDVSRYIGQFAALINAGMDSDTAIVCMSWLREKELNDSNIQMQLEVAKIEQSKARKETL